MGYVNISGTKVYFQHNAGHANQVCLLYIHGSGGSHELWYHQMNLDVNSFALDLPGHGQSEGTAASSIEQSARNVADFISNLPVPHPVYLVGHSMGSAIALTCALDYPELVNGIILIGAGQRMKVMPGFLEDLHNGRNDPEFIRLGFSSQAPAPMVEAMVKTFGEVAPSVLYADFSACNNFDVSGELERIGLPVLLITGAADQLTPLKLSQYMHSHISNCRLEVISNAGHFAMLEKPEEINRLILDFCL
jgi:pimeloyl-ACP methyl ester carboxylesterase